MRPLVLTSKYVETEAKFVGERPSPKAACVALDCPDWYHLSKVLWFLRLALPCCRELAEVCNPDCDKEPRHIPVGLAWCPWVSAESGFI
jgi:hypothetical protein